MPEYRFSYIRGQSKPSHGITAVDDYDAFKQMKAFVEAGGFTYVPGSMETSKHGLDFHKVPEPHPQIDDIRKDNRRIMENLGIRPKPSDDYHPYNDHMK